MLKMISKIVVMLGLVSALFACGGGGGSGSNTNDASNESGTGGDAGNENTDGDLAESETLMLFSGLESENLGAVAWYTVPGADEPAKKGHEYTICNMLVTAYYYFASSEHVDASKVAGIRGKEIINMPNFQAALITNGFTVDQITANLGVSSLGEDKEGQDWKFEGLFETRYYTGGQSTLFLNGEPMVESLLPKITITLDYRDECDLADDVISAVFDLGSLNDASANSSSSVRAVAAAFLDDVGSRRVAFDAVSLQPAIQTDFVENGRVGAFFDMPDVKMLAGE